MTKLTYFQKFVLYSENPFKNLISKENISTDAREIIYNGWSFKA